MLQKHFIIGMPLSGKSTLVSSLKQKMKLKTVDTDAMLVSHYQESTNGIESIQHLYNNLSALEFRNLERTILHSIPQEIELVSCGGGLPCFFDNLSYMKSKGTVIYLKEKVEVLIERNNASAHPVYMNTKLNSIQNVFDAREKIYNQADIIVGFDDCMNYFLSKNSIKP